VVQFGCPPTEDEETFGEWTIRKFEEGALSRMWPFKDWSLLGSKKSYFEGFPSLFWPIFTFVVFLIVFIIKLLNILK